MPSNGGSRAQKILKDSYVPAQRIAFFGPMAVGKSFCASYLLESGYSRYSFAAKLKSLAYELYGVRGKTDGERKILQELGTDIRKHDDTVFIRYLLNQVRHGSPIQKIVVDDLRFKIEADWLRRNDFTLILVTCEEDVRQRRIQNLYPGLDPRRLTHQGEVEWRIIEPDYVVDSTNPGVVTDIERILQNVTYSTSR